MHGHEEFPVVVGEVASNVLRAHLFQEVNSALLWAKLLFQRGLSKHTYDRELFLPWCFIARAIRTLIYNDMALYLAPLIDKLINTVQLLCNIYILHRSCTVLISLSISGARYRAMSL